MRALMLVSEAPPIKSGIARVAEKLADGLRARGVTVDVLSANEIPRWTFKEFRISSLALHWPRIHRLLSGYDIVHVHGTVPSFSDVGLFLSRLSLTLASSQAAIVYTHHSDIDIAGLDAPVRVYSRIHDMLLGLADHVVASTPTYAGLLRAGAKSATVSAVPFGVDAGRFGQTKSKPDRFNALFVGQLRPYKGVDTLLRAWQHIDNADLHIVGNGHERAYLEALARQLKLKSVHFHGSVSEQELQEFYASAHTLVLPSNRKAEAFGLVLLEGMAAGCVPIASSLPGVADVVGITGYTFPVGDSAALAALLKDLRDNPDKRQQMSILASARALGADWHYTADAYYGIYRQAYLAKQLEREFVRGASSSALQRWLSSVVHLSRADRASLMLLEPRGRNMTIAASVGMPTDIVSSAAVGPGEGISGFVAQRGYPLLISKRSMPSVARVYAKHNAALTSSLVVPVQHNGRSIGVLNLARGPERLSFTMADKEWLTQLSLQVAPLLQSYRAGSEFISQRRTVLVPEPGPALRPRQGPIAVKIEATSEQGIPTPIGPESALDHQYG